MGARGHNAHDRERHRAGLDNFSDGVGVIADTPPTGIGDYRYPSILIGDERPAQDGPDPHRSIIIAGHVLHGYHHGPAFVGDGDKGVARRAERVGNVQVLPEPLEEGIGNGGFPAFPQGDDVDE